jgi:hypothetical protein
VPTDPIPPATLRKIIAFIQRTEAGRVLLMFHGGKVHKYELMECAVSKEDEG